MTRVGLQVVDLLTLPVSNLHMLARLNLCLLTPYLSVPTPLSSPAASLLLHRKGFTSSHQPNMAEDERILTVIGNNQELCLKTKEVCAKQW